MVNQCREESFLNFDWATWPNSLALAAMAAGAALMGLTSDLAAQGAGQNSVQAQIQRYGCNLPQYANSVAACRELNARARAQKSAPSAPRTVRQPYSSASTRAPSPPRQSSGGGFFASLFGGGNKTRRANAGTQRTSSYASQISSGPDFGVSGWSGTYSSRMRGSGRYRTLCVRSCDGYYWPVSFSTTRSGFSRDAKQCTASCSAPAKLYIQSNPGADAAQMVDLGGTPYSRMENAFRYRKEYVKECRCKPEPWSEAAQKDYQNRAAEAENPELVKTASAQQIETSGEVSPSVSPDGPDPRAATRKKARWRVRSQEAEFSGQWWAGSW